MKERPLRAPALASYVARLRAGTWRVEVALPEQPYAGSVRAPQVATVAAGATTSAEFHFATGTLRLRVLDPAGKPAVGVPIRLHTNGELRHWLPPTDAEGRTHAIVETDPFVATTPARRDLGAAPGAQISELPLGELQATVDHAAELELRLPAAWAR